MILLHVPLAKRLTYWIECPAVGSATVAPMIMPNHYRTQMNPFDRNKIRQFDISYVVFFFFSF